MRIGSKLLRRTAALLVATSVAVLFVKEITDSAVIITSPTDRFLSSNTFIKPTTRFSRESVAATRELLLSQGETLSMDALKMFVADAPEPINVSLIKRVDRYGNTNPPLYYSQWNHTNELDKYWKSDNTMYNLFQTLACPGSVAIDIGAHGGDTSLALAAAVGPTGLVLAFEPGPPFELLKANIWINTPFNIHAYNFAIDEIEGEWCYTSGCDGCNGGKTKCNGPAYVEDLNLRLTSYRLDNVLSQNYDESIRERISFIKIDAEGYDSDVVRSLGGLINSLQPDVRPTIQVEWYAGYRRDHCTEGTKVLLEAADSINYDVYIYLDKEIPHRFEIRSSCESLPPDSADDLYLFPKERSPTKYYTRCSPNKKALS